MNNELMEERFFTTKRWKPGDECLNIENINQPPSDYKGSFKDWIQELTTFIFLYPKEWKEIYAEYKEIKKKQASESKCGLAFFRDEEGNLRKEGETDVFLRIHLEGADREGMRNVGQSLNWTKIFCFEGYIVYCELDCQNRQKYINDLKYHIEIEIAVILQRQEHHFHINLSFEEDMDGSGFAGRDIYIDALNDTYIIL